MTAEMTDERLYPCTHTTRCVLPEKCLCGFAERAQECLYQIDDDLRRLRPLAERTSYSEKRGGVISWRWRDQCARLDERRSQLISDLHEIGVEYVARTFEFTFDVQAEKRGGGVSYYAVPVRDVCRHTVAAADELEAKHLIVRDHIENCVKGDDKR